MAAEGDGVTAVHVDGGLRAVLSGAVLGARLRWWENQRMLSTYSMKGVYPRGYKEIYAPKLPKLDLTIDAKYVANLININIWL